MDFAEAVAQHQAWKQRLKRILLGRERRRDPARTEATGCQACALDRWLRLTAHSIDDPLVRAIEEKHRTCHDLALQMVRERAEEPLDAVFQTGRFGMASQELLELLELLRRRHGLGKAPLCEISPRYAREFSGPDAPA